MKRNKTLNQIILFTFWFSVAILIWVEILPATLRLQSWWSGVGYKVDNLLSILCSSFITSYIFFYIIVRLKEKNDRNRKREEFNSHVAWYLKSYQEQLNELLEEKEYLINNERRGKPFQLGIERLIYIFEPTTRPEFYTRHADEETKKFLQNRTKKYRNYFFSLNKLIDCIKRHHQLLDYYDDNEIYELFQGFIIINEKENLEEQLNQRANIPQADGKFLYEIDIENIKMFTERIKNEPEYSTGLEINSKEYLDLYYRFAHHLECNIGLLSNYLSKIKKGTDTASEF